MGERQNFIKSPKQWGTGSHKGILLKQSHTGVVKASVYTHSGTLPLHLQKGQTGKSNLQVRGGCSCQRCDKIGDNNNKPHSAESEVTTRMS